MSGQLRKPACLSYPFAPMPSGPGRNALLGIPWSVSPHLWVSNEDEKRETATRQGRYLYVQIKNFRLIGKGVWYWGPLAGNEFDILQCKLCRRQSKKITANY
jgi:hypothetical protein